MKIKKLKFFFLIVCFLQIFYIFQFRSQFSYTIFKNPFNEFSGVEDVVSSEIIEFNNMLKDTNLVEFNLSKKIRENTYLYQRSIEFSYPIRINKSSTNNFFLLEEEIPESCTLVDKRNFLKFSRCLYD